MSSLTQDQITQWINSVGLGQIKSGDNVVRFELLAELAYAAGQAAERESIVTDRILGLDVRQRAAIRARGDK